MTEEIQLSCKLRDKTGRGSARRLRRDGFIPAVVYGKDFDTMHLVMNEREFYKVLNIAGESVLIDLKVEDKEKGFSRPVIIKEIQHDPVSDKTIHVDFQAIRLTEKMRIKVPISTKGEAPGVKAGGILEHIMREVEVECLPRDIPEKIEVDISNLEIGDTLHLKDLSFPPKVVPQGDKEASILSIVPPKVEKEAVPAEEEITEPEVISKEKKKEEEEVTEEAPEKEPSKEKPEKTKPEKK